MHKDQIPMPFNHHASNAAEDFIVTTSNEQAYGAIERWPNWPANIAALIGPEGAGKSHLAFIWQQKSNAVHIASLATDSWAEGLHVIVDDAELYVSCENCQERLFHLYNWTRETGGSMLLVARCEPNRWQVSLPDLKSRLATIPLFHIEEPDDVLMKSVLSKLMSDRQLRLDPSVIDYIILRIERRYAAIHDFVEMLDSQALSKGRRLTKPLARDVLNELSSDSVAQSI